MRVWGVFFTLWCLQAPAVFPATERSPHVLYDAIKALRIDPSNVYRIAPVHHIQLRRGDAVLSFDEGTLAFFSPLDGQITGAVFSGRGHVLAAPRDPVEKQQMGRFLGAPVLDQQFFNGYLRFTDDTAGELLRQFSAANLAAQTDASVGTQWDSAVTQLNPSYTLRILYDRLSPNPKPCFYAGLEGAALMRFGYGIGVAYPPIWLEPLQISRGFDQVLEPGMVFVLHAYLQLLEEGLGIIQGGTYALTETGVEMLVGCGDVELEVV